MPTRDEIEKAFDRSMQAALTGGDNAVHSPQSERVAEIVRMACMLYEDGRAELLACWDVPTKQRVDYTLTTYQPDKLGRHAGFCDEGEKNMRVDAFRCMTHKNLRMLSDAALVSSVLNSLVYEWLPSPEFLLKASEDD